MESPRKFNDCYFYYYSTCTKGDNCVFRHEPSALGCETMCSAWQQGKCLDKRCKLRHMELRKNRKQIPCYWENQPGGCRKKHCPFMHKNPDARTDGIAPSQPAPQQPQVGAVCALEGAAGEVGVAASAAAPPPPAPLPMLWQHAPHPHAHPHPHPHPQRQVVLDSAILGVLPSPSELLGARRVPPHHVEGPNPYAPLPVDPLVVNFEEESDSESAPSSTPTKPARADDELALLERIQAEAAAYYSYDPLPPPPAAPAAPAAPGKYDRRSLDDIRAHKQATTADRRKSLDFKILSLDEIRARKKAETIIQTTPITLNLCRKRKLSTQETVTTSGNKIIKVVRSNSIIYKKLDPNAPANAAEVTKTEQKQIVSVECRKRTVSELSDAYEIQADELVDNCYEFKRIKVPNHTSKPRLIRNRNVSLEASTETNTEVSKNEDNDSDSEVQIVSVDIVNTNVDISDCDIIDVESTNIGEPIDIVDLSDEDEVTITSSELANNVPDVVASCHQKACSSENNLLDDITVVYDDTLKDIDALLNEDLNTIEDDDL